MLKDIHRKIWSEMFEMHSALVNKYQLFLHETPGARLECIRKKGLRPKNPGGSLDDEYPIALGLHEPKMVCVHPCGTNEEKHSNHDGPYALLAVTKDVLPRSVTLDWSCMSSWPLAPILESDNPTWGPKEVFLEIVRRRGTVAVLETIPAQVLLVLCKDRSLGWAALTTAREESVYFYDITNRPGIEEIISLDIKTLSSPS